MQHALEADRAEHYRPLLLLDEPTDGVDMATEDALLTALPAVTAGRITILISHRAEVLARCHRAIDLPAAARPALRAAAGSPRPAPQKGGRVAMLAKPPPTPPPPGSDAWRSRGWPAVEPACGPPRAWTAHPRRTARRRSPRQRGGAHRDLRLARHSGRTAPRRRRGCRRRNRTRAWRARSSARRGRSGRRGARGPGRRGRGLDRADVGGGRCRGHGRGPLDRGHLEIRLIGAQKFIGGCRR
jgi:hypothetical protein